MIRRIITITTSRLLGLVKTTRTVQKITEEPPSDSADSEHDEILKRKYDLVEYALVAKALEQVRTTRAPKEDE